jgi:hypothetical protein
MDTWTWREVPKSPGAYLVPPVITPKVVDVVGKNGAPVHLIEQIQ